MPDEFRRGIAESQIGGVYRLQDIPGVGTQTLSSLRRIGVRDVDDVSRKTVEQLAQAEGVGRKTAREIKQAVPEDNAQSTSSESVSAAGIRAPFGEFKVEIGDHDKAQARFDSSLKRGIGHSQEAAQADKGKRAPITTDLDEWKANKGLLDFPGVDTPSEEPEAQQQDRAFLAPDDLLEDASDRLF